MVSPILDRPTILDRLSKTEKLKTEKNDMELKIHQIDMVTHILDRPTVLDRPPILDKPSIMDRLSVLKQPNRKTENRKTDTLPDTRHIEEVITKTGFKDE